MKNNLYLEEIFFMNYKNSMLKPLKTSMKNSLRM